VHPPIRQNRGIDLMAMKNTGAKTQSLSQTGFNKRAWLTAARLGLFLAGLFLAQPAIAEEARPPQAPPAQQQAKEPGVFESITRWFENGFSNLKNGMKGGIDNLGDKAANTGKTIGDKAAEVGKGAADATKGAVDAVAKLPSTRVVEGRERCEVSLNGAPDCRTAAQSICTAKGLAGGTSMDFVSAEKCPSSVWINRRKPEPGECTTETFVTRAMCQSAASR